MAKIRDQAMTIGERVEMLLKQIPDDVTVCAATKRRTSSEISEAISAGITNIGENYVQEAAWKQAEVSASANWHMLGHLQTNKVRQALSLFDLIQSLDSIRLAERIDRIAAESDQVVSTLIEVNIAGEATKSGIKEADLEELLAILPRLAHLRVEGLMVMPPYFIDQERARPYFKRARNLFDTIATARIENVNMKILSMGMSHDWQIAIEEGSTMVRIGTAIFGTRK
ncbi:YggS family pyridoxal phosphate-dependent enzyme [Candidatus Acetothermia bacterium]|nr:YggS family pyridoxal phosphate-dependent enzyme [Candidatus Acetothermia bacterium]